MRRSLFVCGGLCVGAAAVLTAQLADRAQDVFATLVARSFYLPLALTPLGFALSAWLTTRIFPGAGGSGIPQVIAARRLEGDARQRLVSLRVMIGKILCLLIGLLCGASIGREGPTVQIGASVMNLIGRWLPAVDRSALLLAGAAAGIAAAFNTPLAGIVFGIEELSRSFEARTSGLALGCVIAAGITSLALLGDYTYFGTTATALPLGRAWLAVIVCGILGGLGGGLFGRAMVVLPRGIPGRLGAFVTGRPVAFATACGFGVALCGLAGNGVHGTGYGEASALVHGEHVAAAAFPLAKFAASVLSAISGIPGGIFAPSLAVGAGIGSSLSEILGSTNAGAFAIVGMVAYLAGVLQTPITSFVIVSEMTQNHAMVIPLMIAAVVATAVSRLVNPHGLYHALSEAFAPPEPPVQGERADHGP